MSEAKPSGHEAESRDQDAGPDAPRSILYRIGQEGLDVDNMTELYVASTLGERRPVDDRDRMAGMLAGANLIVTAWDGVLLVGISRALTDWSYATYLSDLAVRDSHQRQGIGRELIWRTKAAAPRARVILLSAPGAVEYYPRVGLERFPAAFVTPD
jgi:GNAT superfamily N-acetyltransferase